MPLNVNTSLPLSSWILCCSWMLSTLLSEIFHFLCFALALSKEVRSQGIKIACVRPGDTKTGFTEARDKNEQTNEAYGDIINKKTRNMERFEINGMQPIAVSKLVYKVARRKNPPLISSVGFGYKFISSLLKIMPVRWSNYFIYKYY